MYREILCICRRKKYNPLYWIKSEGHQQTDAKKLLDTFKVESKFPLLFGSLLYFVGGEIILMPKVVLNVNLTQEIVESQSSSWKNGMCLSKVYF